MLVKVGNANCQGTIEAINEKIIDRKIVGSV